jgi:Holliday junction resolvase-like predicted endonuclease
VSAIRYKLKQAMLEMGPTGYPFEHFIGQVFKKTGYSVEIDIILQGRCVTHEMDVIATKDHEQHLVECKYRQDQGKIVTVQTPLYVRARVDDIVNKYREDNRFEGYKFTGWVVTNTRFSSDSVSYGKCSELRMMSWDYPEGNALKDIIEREKLYPITALTSLSRKEKLQLLDEGIVTCLQLQENLNVLDKIQFRRNKSPHWSKN